MNRTSAEEISIHAVSPVLRTGATSFGLAGSAGAATDAGAAAGVAGAATDWAAEGVAAGLASSARTARGAMSAIMAKERMTRKLLMPAGAEAPFALRLILLCTMVTTSNKNVCL